MRSARLNMVLAGLAGAMLATEAPAAPAADEIALAGTSVLDGRRWIHGTSDCAVNADPAIDIYAHDQTTYIFRQNKCMTFEAPFMYLLVGANKIVIFDSGAIDDQSAFPFYQTIRTVLGESILETREILVLHSHSHSDHYRGDAQLEGKAQVTLVKTTGDAVRRFFGFEEWPQGQANVELGGRTLMVIPTPGHQEEAIALYDPQTQWLLTGDTLYPGYIYVKNWQDYKSSIARLARFSESHEVSAILGAHIEMTREPGHYYPIGTTFQPDEAALELTPDSLRKLNRALQASDEQEELVFDEFIVAPMNVVQRTLSNFARWMTQ